MGAVHKIVSWAGRPLCKGPSPHALTSLPRSFFFFFFVRLIHRGPATEKSLQFFKRHMAVLPNNAAGPLE